MPVDGVAAALAIERLVVGRGRLLCEVRLDPRAPRTTTADLMQTVLASFPHLPVHTCVNERGGTFSAVMEDTPLPHLLEHVIIDLQTHRSESDDAVFVGTTEWMDEAAGIACVQVSFTDDLMALRAVRDAVRFLNEAIVLP